MQAAPSASPKPGRSRKQSLMNRRAASDRNRHRLMEPRSPGGRPPRERAGASRPRGMAAAAAGASRPRGMAAAAAGANRSPGAAGATAGADMSREQRQIRTSGGTRAPRGGHRPIQGRPRQGQWPHTYLFPVKSREMSCVSSRSIDESRVLRENTNRYKSIMKAM